jgi:serine/threonine-protein kinase
MPSSSEDAVLGQVLSGRYRLQRVRLRGIFGVVFAADEYFGRTFVRPVHAKVSRQTGITDVTAPHFFADVIRLAQWLADQSCAGRQHLPAVLDLGLLPSWNHSGFVVTEAVEGTPLLQWQPQGNRPDLETQLMVFKDLCRTLAAVHQLGVVHRELRPDAVVLGADGTVRLLGLGLATVAEPLAHIAEAGSELLAHLAPELLQGLSGPSADVYALGLILYEWLTGGGPHLTAPWSSVHSFAAALHLKQHLTFTAPSVLRPEILTQAAWLDELVLRCLDYDPRQRLRDAGHLMEALEICAAGGPLPEPSAESGPLAAATFQRNDDPGDALIRGARRHLARGAAKEAIDQLDVHRPAEWAVVDRQGVRLLRVLGQAYVRQGDWRSARECLEQLRSVQREQRLLEPPHYAAALTDLLRCYLQLGLNDLAQALKQEARELAQAPR